MQSHTLTHTHTHTHTCIHTDTHTHTHTHTHTDTYMQSYTRQLLLQEMGVEYECEPADIDEKAIRDNDPQVFSVECVLYKMCSL